MIKFQETTGLPKSHTL